MNTITPLWSDPVGWSHQVAKTKLRVVVWTLMHIAFISCGLLMLKLEIFELIAGVAPIVLCGVMYPCLYMCAMHQLLEKAKNQQPAEQKPGSYRRQAAESSG